MGVDTVLQPIDLLYSVTQNNYRHSMIAYIDLNEIADLWYYVNTSKQACSEMRVG